MQILLLGPQGSGKGTQGQRICREYGIAHVATGEMLRAAVAEGTETGRRVKPILEAGELVPDELMIELIRERLAADDARDGFVLDGFPRTAAQAEALDEMLREASRELDIVFELQVSDDVSFERLRRRAAAEGRTDDTPEAIRRRLENYHRQTAPLVEYYRLRGILVGIHGERSINEVFAEIQAAIEQWARRAA